MINAEVEISAPDATLYGHLVVPDGAKKVVLFVHGSGSSRFSRRNIFVATKLQSAGIGTLLFDLLTQEEEAIDSQTAHLRFDINLLSERLYYATRWVQQVPNIPNLKIGYFGASTGGAAALMTGAALGDEIGAIVSRGGRPDLAGKALPQVKAPTLLIVGGLDEIVISLNQQAYEKLQCEKAIEIVPGASHLFEEPGKLEAVAELATDWFSRHLN